MDEGLNIVDEFYSYKVNFYINEDDFLGLINGVFFVYFSIVFIDNVNNLSWMELVFWDNF